MIICGEASGDLLAAELIDAIRLQDNGETNFFGLFGAECAARGLQSEFDLSELAVMGFTEILPKFLAIKKRVTELVDLAVKRKPDCVIFVDSFAFTHPIAKRLREKAPNIKRIRYVAPKLWAWAPWRAKKLRGVYDDILSLFPFEPEFFAAYSIKTRFVGHPAIDRFVQAAPPEKIAAFNERYDFAPQDKIITLLPGSRRSEVSRLRPVFFDMAKKLHAAYPDYKFAIVTPETLTGKTGGGEGGFPLTHVTSADRFTLFARSDTAIAASGTVSLELTVAGVPHIIAYRVGALSAFIARRLIKVKYAALTNIILDKPVIPEFLQEKCETATMLPAFEALLTDKATRAAQSEAFKRCTDLLYPVDAEGKKRKPAEAAALSVGVSEFKGRLLSG